jgi:peptidoglycan L-alanyl-D-glutamate endopeptidase CwlK
MPKFGMLSEQRLATCDERLQRVMRELIKLYDVTILFGHRDEAAQNEAFKNGATTKRWPDSKHNRLPSLAVDVAPWPVDWKNIPRFWFMGGLVLGIAQQLNIQLRWGRDWDRDMDFNDQHLNDFPHFELIG